MPIVPPRDLPIPPRRDDGLRTTTPGCLDDPVAIIPLVAHVVVGTDRPDRRLGLRHVGHLTLGHVEPDRVAEGIDGGVELGAEPADGATQGLRSLPPFFPAAC